MLSPTNQATQVPVRLPVNTDLASGKLSPRGLQMLESGQWTCEERNVACPNWSWTCRGAVRLGCPLRLAWGLEKGAKKQSEHEHGAAEGPNTPDCSGVLFLRRDF